MQPDREALLAAVNKLVLDSSADNLYNILLEVIPVARRLGVRLSGPNAVLNPLVDLAVEHPEKYANVMQLIETKRTDQGIAPLDQTRTTDGQFDKSEYMREFMQQKRERERKAVEIENLMRGEHDKLVGRARLDYMQAQSNRWKKDRDALLAKARASAGAGLSKDAMRTVLTGFWAKVDADLDELEKLARAESQMPANQRAKKVGR